MVEDIILKNKATGAEISLSKLSTPDYVLENVDWGEIQGTHYSNKYVGQVGVTVTNTILGTRGINITGWVLSEEGSGDLMSQRKAILNSFVNPDQEIQLTYEDYTITFKPDSTIKYSTNGPDNHEFFCKFKISGECFNPVFEDITETIVYAAAIEGKFKFPLVIPTSGFIFGRRTLSSFFNIKYLGIVESGIIIKIRANGAVTNPRIIHRDTQKQFMINKSLVAGEEITINTNKGARKVIGNIGLGEINYFKYKDYDSDWLQIVKGDNVFKIDAASGIENLDVIITYKNKYLEVQEC